MENNQRKFKAGDKVIPLTKTFGCPLEESYAYSHMKKKGLDYLLVEKYDRDDSIVVCDGDFFNESDLTLQKEVIDNVRITKLERALRIIQREALETGDQLIADIAELVLEDN